VLKVLLRHFCKTRFSEVYADFETVEKKDEKFANKKVIGKRIFWQTGTRIFLGELFLTISTDLKST
jgi:hypothetical protein